MDLESLPSEDDVNIAAYDYSTSSCGRQPPYSTRRFHWEPFRVSCVASLFSHYIRRVPPSPAVAGLPDTSHGLAYELETLLSLWLWTDWLSLRKVFDGLLPG